MVQEWIVGEVAGENSQDQDSKARLHQKSECSVVLGLRRGEEAQIGVGNRPLINNVCSVNTKSSESIVGRSQLKQEERSR